MNVHPIHGGPTHCPAGHSMDGPNGRPGWTGCECPEPHRTWTCWTCKRVVACDANWPPKDEAARPPKGPGQVRP